MNPPPTSVRTIALRRMLTAALLCIAALPPLAVWAIHAGTTTTTAPDSRTVHDARTYAIDNVAHWSEPSWQTDARAYFSAHQVDAELRPAQGPWFDTLAAPTAARVSATDKFAVPSPTEPKTLLGSGWIIARTSTQTGWTLALTAGALTLALAVAATGILLGRHVLRPLAAIDDAAATLPHGAGDLQLPATRIREVAAVTAALQQMGDDLHTALDRQADLEEQRRQFIGAVAHDLRTPLFTLRSYLDGLHDGLATTPLKTARYLDAARTSATALDRLITDLFTYARMEYLDQRPHHETVDLAALLHRTARAHQPRADAKHIALTVTTPAKPCTLIADQHLLTRALDNLIDNALRHTPDHGRIELHAGRTQTEIVLTVTDNGPGIAPADLPHLFTPLYRGENSRNRATGGAGLGLTIAHRIIHTHHGTLTAQNTTPHGARFTARLPTTAPTSPPDTNTTPTGRQPAIE